MDLESADIGAEIEKQRRRVRQRERQKRYYAKMKKDPVRWQKMLAKGRRWNTKFRQARGYKYVQQLARNRARRSLNPFKYREQKRAYYQRVKADPVAYRGHLEKIKRWYRAKMEKLAKDPAARRAWLDERKVYLRYHRIVVKARAQGDSYGNASMG